MCQKYDFQYTLPDWTMEPGTCKTIMIIFTAINSQSKYVIYIHICKFKRRCTPTPPNQCPYQVSTSYTLRFPRFMVPIPFSNLNSLCFPCEVYIFPCGFYK